MPRVSVNICCYNGEKHITSAVQSVLNQTFSDLEIIVINDGSKDGTEKAVLAFQDVRIKYYFQQNEGLAKTRNRAFALSGGEFITILDQDDIWEPEKLALQVDVMERNPEVGVVYSDVYVIDEHDIIRGTGRRARYRRGKVAPELLKGNYIYCPTVMFRASVLKKAGQFRTDLKIGEEYDMYLRLARICAFDFVDKPLARYRVHSDNASRDMVRNYTETVMCLTDFAAAANDEKLSRSAMWHADINRLKLMAALVWDRKCKEVSDILPKLRSGFLIGAAGFGLRLLAFAPHWIARFFLLPLKSAGIVR